MDIPIDDIDLATFARTILTAARLSDQISRPVWIVRAGLYFEIETTPPPNEAASCLMKMRPRDQRLTSAERVIRALAMLYECDDRAA